MTKTSVTVADASAGHWVTRSLPEGVQPYAQLMRLDRPIGLWLLLIPCWWGQALAHIAQGTPINLWHALLYLVGAIVMRGAGCTLNDILDSDIDAKVARTRLRPIASGRISVLQAIIFLVPQLLIGLAVLMQFSTFTVILGFCIVPVIAIYPLMKRITSYPQVVLGIAFNWGVLVGWAALQGSLSLAPLLMYAAAISWTLAYDTIYAHQDKDDDAVIGVHSTALKFGDDTPIFLIVCFGFALAAFVAAAISVSAGWPFYFALAAAGFHAAWQIARFDGDEPKLCLKLFKSNRTFGLIILSGLLLDIFL